MNRNDEILAALHTLDPADRPVDPTRGRAREDLHAILAQNPTRPAGPPAGSPRPQGQRPRRPTRRVRRGVLLGAVAAVAAGSLVVLPSLTGGDPAFATWEAAPTGLSPAQRAEAAEDCRKQQRNGFSEEYEKDLDAAELAIAERRGVWQTVILTGANGFSALCITDDTAGWFDGGMIGSIGAPSGYVAPGPREVVAGDLGMGIVGGEMSLAAGAAGSDVAAVTYRSQSHGDVAATVNAGRFALWFPGDELKYPPSGGVPVEVTYRDGQTGTSRLSL